MGAPGLNLASVVVQGPNLASVVVYKVHHLRADDKPGSKDLEGLVVSN